MTALKYRKQFEDHRLQLWVLNQDSGEYERIEGVFNLKISSTKDGRTQIHYLNPDQKLFEFWDEHCKNENALALKNVTILAKSFPVISDEVGVLNEALTSLDLHFSKELHSQVISLWKKIAMMIKLAELVSPEEYENYVPVWIQDRD